MKKRDRLQVSALRGGLKSPAAAEFYRIFGDLYNGRELRGPVVCYRMAVQWAVRAGVAAQSIPSFSAVCRQVRLARANRSVNEQRLAAS
jgi:hypothetical protein